MLKERDERGGYIIPSRKPKPDAVAFAQKCRELRDGSPNAFYAHVDAFCKAVAASLDEETPAK